MSAVPNSASPTTTAVVTVSYRSEDVLPSFLSSITLSVSRPVQIVIADNHGDEKVKLLADRAHAHYLSIPDNPGYGAGMNAGVASLPAGVDWILLSNPDVVLGPGSLDRLLVVAESNPDIAAVGPAILTADGQVYPSARALPSLRTGIGHALFSTAWPSNPWSRRYRRPGLTEQTDVGWLSGACLLVRREAFERIGGFDEAFFMYFEDVDLGRRFSLNGLRNVYEPDAVVTHSGAHSTATESERMIDEHHRSARVFIGKKYGTPVLAPLRAALGIGLSIRALIERRRARRAQPSTSRRR